MKIRLAVACVLIATMLSGCEIINHAFCTNNCQAQTHNSSSLVSFLYPNGEAPPVDDSVPQLRVPLRVGLAFLPSKASYGAAPLDAAQKEALLEKIRQRFSNRKFISELVVVPDYYLDASKGMTGLEGVQRLYGVDLMALVSYDQVTHRDDNKLSLGYLTIVGAYVLRGTSHETATLVDLAVVDPVTRSLVLRAGGTDQRDDKSTLVDVERDTRKASRAGFDAATDQMISHFDAALTAFEANVRNGNAHVNVVKRNGTAGMGGGAVGGWEVVLLLMLVAGRVVVGHARRQSKNCRS
jgi:rhombotail lipoprotein